ncbi:MAG TPA: hypothetical protein VFH41_07955 [Bradyrhizobium sp.]|nr:hypothetical protein [Bradyrhizobium sp.]
MLSFGHFHAEAAQAVPAIQSLQQAPFHHDSDQTSHDPCEVCAVIAMAGTALSATPPLLSLPQAIEFSHPTVDTGFIHLNPIRVAFQPRAPPIS